jgi:HAD superfamily hydrolase (TIGR01484 family)
MRYRALACDYDGTIALHGVVDEPTFTALQDVRKSGRRLILVTGRELDELGQVFPRLDIFDRIVAENGALLYRPETREEIVLAEPPPPSFAQELARRGAVRVSVGRVIVATWEPYEKIALQVIHDFGLELQVIFNKGAVMILPSGVNKATGLTAALLELGLSPHNVVGVGDAENDHAFLAMCEVAVAVRNALVTLKERVDWVTAGDHGAGIVELVRELVGSDLENLGSLPRHHVLLGTEADKGDVLIQPNRNHVWIAGTSVTSFLERLSEKAYQYIVIDPGGHSSTAPNAVILGDNAHAPGISEIMDLLSRPNQNVVVNLAGMESKERPEFLKSLIERLQGLRGAASRPHWIVLLMTPEERLSSALLSAIDVCVAIDKNPLRALKAFSGMLGTPPPPIKPVAVDSNEGLAWFWRHSPAPFQIRVSSLSAPLER